jgi:hypothetical protein
MNNSFSIKRCNAFRKSILSPARSLGNQASGSARRSMETAAHNAMRNLRLAAALRD